MIEKVFSKKASMVSYDQETIDILRLIRSENVGPKTFTGLIKLFGDAKTALENIQEFSLKGGRLKPIKVYSAEEACAEIEKLSKINAHLITYKSPKYSQLLLNISDFPPVLTYKGNIDLLTSDKCIAIVGARNASANGKFFAVKISKDLIDAGYTVISGLARGIDASAHESVTNKAIAVIAGGIDHIYPPENTKLYQQISNEGLIIAELPIGCKPLAQHFPQRNRLISGLSLGVVVIEASLKSGTLITARLALEQNREVFAVPGSPLDERNRGTNKLIKEGAHLIESVEDIISNMPSSVKLELPFHEYVSSDFKPLDVKDDNITNNMRKEVFELLSPSPIDFDYLIKETQLSLPIVYTIIIELELAGKITRLPGNKIALRCC